MLQAVTVLHELLGLNIAGSILDIKLTNDFPFRNQTNLLE